MDHFSKALEHAKRDGHSVRDWVRPTPEPSADEPGAVAGRSASLDPAHLQAHRVLRGDPADDQIAVDRYRMLRTQLVQRMKAKGWSRLAITSAGPKAGKTLTSLNLAMSIARDGNQRVVLIDADLRKPSVASYLGLEPGPGLVDYLDGSATLDQVLVGVEGKPNLTIVPGRPLEAADVKPELLNSSQMLKLLEQVDRRDRWTIVVVDMPPVFVGDDVILLAENMDGVLLIVEEGATEVDELRKAAEMLVDFNLLGTVLNNSREKRKDFAGYYYAATAQQQTEAR